MTDSATSLNSFLPLAKIGQGTFSSVYKVKRVSDQQVYALKKIKIACLKQKQKSNALNQIRILASLTSNYIISYKQAFFDQKLHLLCIIMEWANDGDLLKQISNHREQNRKFPEQQIWKAAYHILSGLYILHKNSILHRDLKAANIFICDGAYKLGDLNVSKVKDHQHSLVQTQTGTPFYASPQIWRDQPYGSESDIWSFGCILYQMCCFHPPFNGKDLNELYKSVQRGIYNPIPKTYSKQLQRLIGSCLNQKSYDRPTAAQLLKDGGLVLTRCEFYEIEFDRKIIYSNKDTLLQTIKMPNDIKYLNKELPQSKYQNHLEIDKGKTLIKPSPHYGINYQHSTVVKLKPNQIIQQIKKQETPINNSLKMSQKGSPSVPQKSVTPIPISQKIKNQLNKIGRQSEQRVITNNCYIDKIKVLSSNSAQKNKILSKKLEEYLTPIKQIPDKKKRPFSCNYANAAKQVDSYYIKNLKQYSKPTSNKVYNSDRKVMLRTQEKAQLISDRRKLTKDPRDAYYQQLIRNNKYRCRSANHQQSTLQSLSNLKHRLQLKYNNILQPEPTIFSSNSDRRLFKLKQHIKSQASLSHLPSSNYSYNRNIYRSPQISKGYPVSSKNDAKYFIEAQRKILSSANLKQKKSDHMSNLKRGAIRQNQTQIRRLVKGSNFFCKSYNRL